MMPKLFFNTTGPCNPDKHYMLSPDERLVGAQLDRYIRNELYWVLHAPRQVGKTTFLQTWMRKINDGDEAVACYVSVERCQGITDIERAMPAISNSIREHARQYDLPVPELDDVDPAGMLYNVLANWSRTLAPKPLVVLFDEVDVLEGAAMVSMLRQLRNGFATRAIGKFPISIVLVGMRDLKDYITASKDGVAPNPGSPFNIKEDSATLSNFNKEDVIKLFALRTEETGQQITREALDYVYEQSQGQPWIVNQLFKRATLQILGENNTATVTLEHIEKAREQMTMSRETHLDALGERLKEPRIRRVIQTIMTGETDGTINRMDPDVMLATDLGLIKWDLDKGFTIANPIYEEVLTRVLNIGFHDNIPSPTTWRWQTADGRLDMNLLLREFQDFWRHNSDTWQRWTSYTHAFPQLLLMAFLQRVVNAQGRVKREYAAGSGRMDLAVEYKGEWNIIEVKLLRSGQTFDWVKAKGMTQVVRYRDTFTPPTGCHKNITGVYLIIFDRRPKNQKAPWDERITWEVDGDVKVLGC